jgi:predicted TIM-barrel fold metal-dependent hydrolase
MPRTAGQRRRLRAMMIIDTHAHVFDRRLRLAPDARYAPGYDATLFQYLGQLDANSVAAGVLVQPSFLGTDNRHLLQALGHAPRRLRGVAAVDELAGQADLARLHKGGVRGIRINPFQRAPRPQLRSGGWRELLAHAGALGWHVVIHEEGEALIDLLAQLSDCPAALVIDHLGRPGANKVTNSAVERAVLEQARRGPLYVKLSAPYRGDADAMTHAASRYLEFLGPQQLLWGSDWPWPNFEGRHEYVAMLGWLEQVVPQREQRAALHATAARLYGFDTL